MEKLFGSLAVFLGPFIAVGVVIAILYHVVTDVINWHAVGKFIVVSSIIGTFSALAIIGYLQSDTHKRRKEEKRYGHMPEDGPMKIDLRTSEIYKNDWRSPDGNHYGTNWKRLHINFQISKKDAKALEKSGLILYTMFRYPHPKFPDVEQNFNFAQLFYPHATIDFPTLEALDRAKAQLLENLNTLRTRLEQQKEHVVAVQHGHTKETFEI
jgi:hypothetical protein